MEIDQHQFPVRFFYRETADQQAPLQVQHPDRPGERNRQGDPFSFRGRNSAQRIQAAFHVSYGRNRIRNKKRIEIIGKGFTRGGNRLAEDGTCINSETPGGIDIHFLQDQQIRVQGFQRITDAGKIGEVSDEVLDEFKVFFEEDCELS